MGFRFRKSFKLAPGVRLNMSGSGFSWTLGPRGASMNFSSRGTRRNIDLPGGFSFQDRVSGLTKSSDHSGSLPAEGTNLKITIRTQDDGTLAFDDADGNPLPAHLVTMAKEQQGDAIKNLLIRGCEEMNQKMDGIESIHLQTPHPNQNPGFVSQPFTGDPPIFPFMQELGFAGKVFPWVKRRIRNENEARVTEYQDRMRTWETMKAVHDKKELERRRFIDDGLGNNTDAMQALVMQRLQGIQWPRETAIQMEISPDGERVALDVDLPEIEDIPTKVASYSGRGWKLTVKTLSETKVAQLYMRHIHGIGFRVVGEVFATLPRVRQITLSGYSQRPSPATGQVVDDYLYSVRVSRERWAALNFSNLHTIDVCEALAGFELRRDTGRAGKLRAIDPFPA